MSHAGYWYNKKCICIKNWDWAAAPIEVGDTCLYYQQEVVLINSWEFGVQGILTAITKETFDEHFVNYDEWIAQQRDKKLEELL